MLGFILHLIKIMPISDGMYYSLAPLAIAGLALGGAQALGGLFQIGSAGKRRKEPKYEIPQEVFDIERERRGMIGIGIDEATKQQLRENTARAALFGLRASQDRRGGQAYASIGEELMRKGAIDIASRDAAMREQRFKDWERSAMALSQYKDKAFGNQWQSWANREQQRQETRTAGFQNMFGGITSGLGFLSMGLAGGGGKTPKTFNPNNKFLNGEIPKVFNEPYAPSAASMSLSGMRSPFSSFSIMNANIPSSSTQSSYMPMANMPGYGAAMQDLFSSPF